MLVTFMTPLGRAGGDFDTTAVWTCPAARQTGSLTCFVPRSSPAFAFLADDGNFLLEANDARLGLWRGVAQAPTFAPNGATVAAQELAQPLLSRAVRSTGTHLGVTAGAIAHAAVQDAIGGLGGLSLTIGTFVEAAPVIPQFDFRGQTLGEVLGTLTAATGQEWELTDGGAFNWRPPRGSLYAAHLCDDGDLVEVARQGSLDDRVVAVVARSSDGQTYTARAPEADVAGFWPKSVTISVSTTSFRRLAVEAELALAQRRFPTITYSAGLLPQHWASVREGDYLLLVLPRSGFSGECPVVRVLSRRYQPGAATVGLELTRLRPFDLGVPASVGAGRPDGSAAFVPYATDPLRILNQGVYDLGRLQAGSPITVG